MSHLLYIEASPMKGASTSSTVAAASNLMKAVAYRL